MLMSEIQLLWNGRPAWTPLFKNRGKKLNMEEILIVASECGFDVHDHWILGGDENRLEVFAKALFKKARE